MQVVEAAAVVFTESRRPASAVWRLAAFAPAAPLRSSAPTAPPRRSMRRRDTIRETRALSGSSEELSGMIAAVPLCVGLGFRARHRPARTVPADAQLVVRAVSSTTKLVARYASSTPVNFRVTVWPASEERLKDFLA